MGAAPVKCASGVLPKGFVLLLSRDCVEPCAISVSKLILLRSLLVHSYLISDSKRTTIHDVVSRRGGRILSSPQIMPPPRSPTRLSSITPPLIVPPRCPAFVMGGSPVTLPNGAPFLPAGRVREIVGWSGDSVNGVQVVYDVEGDVVRGPKRVGDHGLYRQSKIVLDVDGGEVRRVLRGDSACDPIRGCCCCRGEYTRGVRKLTGDAER